MFGVVAAVVLALSFIAGLNIEENLPIALACGGMAVLVLLGWGISEWIRIGHAVQYVAPPQTHSSVPSMPPHTYVSPPVEPTSTLTPSPKVMVQEEETPSVRLPQRIDGHPIAHQYKDVKAEVVNKDILYEAAKQNKWEFTAKKGQDGYHLFILETDAAIVHTHESLFNEWLLKGYPYKAVLRKLTPDGDLTLHLVFYKDKRIGQEFREQTVVKLTGYKNEDVQDYLLGYGPGDPLELEESDEVIGRIDVVKDGFRLGSLPAKIAKRCEDCDPYVFVESIDLDDDGEYYVPTVRIYW